MSKIVVFNHKGGYPDIPIREYLEYFDTLDNVYTALSYTEIHNANSFVSIMSQNVSLHKGTGQVNMDTLSHHNVVGTIVGHSECRDAGESDDEIMEKVRLLSSSNMICVLCIGEDISHRYDYHDVLREELSVLECYQGGRLMIGYEPLWSIGSGVLPSADEIHSRVEYISNVLDNMNIDAEILYGGSVDDENIIDIINIDKVDGVLVGGASLNYDKAKRIVDRR